MKRRYLALLILPLTSLGCESTTQPIPATTYALQRIGNERLPIRLSPGDPYPLLLADTLVLPESRPHQTSFTLTWVQVIEQNPVAVDRQATQHAGSWDNALQFDSCPINAFCIASLVYAPLTFELVGDSLVQRFPTGQAQPPRVYGPVRPR